MSPGNNQSIVINFSEIHLRFKIAANSSMMKAIIIPKPGVYGVEAGEVAGWGVSVFFCSGAAMKVEFALAVGAGVTLDGSIKVMVGMFDLICDRVSPLYSTSV